MPAITVDDVLVLPRLPRLPEQTRFRPVRRLTTAPHGLEGEGFPVRRAFAGVPLSELDPFIHLDQMGEVDYAPGEPNSAPPGCYSPRHASCHLLGGRVRPAVPETPRQL